MKAADNSINKEAREALVEGFSKALTEHIPCLEGDRWGNALYAHKRTYELGSVVTAAAAARR